MTDESTTNLFDTRVKLTKLDVYALRVPATPPVQTSFGIMTDRPTVLLRVEDSRGQHGWGEIWSNFPAVGAEHRGRMAAHYLPALALETEWNSPVECFNALTQKLAVLAIQAGESGPIQSIIAGLDVAIWDMVARRSGLALWRMFRANKADITAPVAVYASGMNPTRPEELAAMKLAEGYRAFKLKVGFGLNRDMVNLRAVREVIGLDLALMIDANQAWALEHAIDSGRAMAQFDLTWLEEPIRADSPPHLWSRLAKLQPIPLAGGENLLGRDALTDFAATDGTSIVQPDIGKWGGFSGCVPVGRTVHQHNKRFCPHWLGSGVGLVASLHLKAAVGGAGYVEVDANPNELRGRFAGEAFQLKEGRAMLSEAAGLGVEPDIEACKEFITFHSIGRI